MAMSSFKGAGSSWSNLKLLTECAMLVGQCNYNDSVCDHSDPTSCFLTVTKAKNRKRKAEAAASSLQFCNIPRMKRSKLFHRSPSAVVFPSIHDVNSVSPPPNTTITLFPLAPDQKPILAPPPITTIVSNSDHHRHRPPPLRAGEDSVSSFPSSLRAKVSESVGESVEGEFTLVVRKKLRQTDLRIHNCRLSIPTTKVANEFLTAGENRELDTARHTKIGCFIDPDMEVSRQVSLRRWAMGSGYVDNIIGEGWKNVLKKQRSNLIDLAENDVVELWSFRSSSGELCFVLVTLEASQKAEKEQGLMMIEYGTSPATSSAVTREDESPLQIVSTGNCDDIDLTLRL